MRTLIALVQKDIAVFCRNRAAVVLTFIVPIGLIYIFGQVFGLNRKEGGPNGIPLGVVTAVENSAAKTVVNALQAEKAFRVITTTTTEKGPARPLTENDAREMIRRRELRFAVILPEDLIRETGLGLHLKILSDPRNEIESQTVQGLLQKTILSRVPTLLGQSLQAAAQRALSPERWEGFNQSIATAVAAAFGGDVEQIRRRMASGDFIPGLADAEAPTEKSGSGSGSTSGEVSKPSKDLFSKLINVETEQVVGKQVQSPEATRVVGGWAMMFLLFSLSNGSAAFFDEKNSGLFQRLLSAPVTRAQLLWSRFVFGVLLGLVQLCALFTAGNLLYGIDVFHHVPGLIVVCTAAAAACTSFGMLVAAISPNAQASSGISTFLVLTMSATGGAWFPMSFMPSLMQTVGKFTLVYWSMEGFAQVLWAGNTLAELLPTVGVLVAISAGVMGLAVWRLNRRNLFG